MGWVTLAKSNVGIRFRQNQTILTTTIQHWRELEHWCRKVDKIGEERKRKN